MYVEARRKKKLFGDDETRWFVHLWSEYWAPTDDRLLHIFNFRNEERSWILRRDRTLTLIKQNRVHGRRAEIVLKYFDKLRCCTRLESAIGQVNLYKESDIVGLAPTSSSHVQALQMAKDVRRLHYTQRGRGNSFWHSWAEAFFLVSFFLSFFLSLSQALVTAQDALLEMIQCMKRTEAVVENQSKQPAAIKISTMLKKLTWSLLRDSVTFAVGEMTQMMMSMERNNVRKAEYTMSTYHFDANHSVLFLGKMQPGRYWRSSADTSGPPPNKQRPRISLQVSPRSLGATQW